MHSTREVLSIYLLIYVVAWQPPEILCLSGEGMCMVKLQMLFSDLIIRECIQKADIDKLEIINLFELIGSQIRADIGTFGECVQFPKFLCIYSQYSFVNQIDFIDKMVCFGFSELVLNSLGKQRIILTGNAVCKEMIFHFVKPLDICFLEFVSFLAGISHDKKSKAVTGHGVGFLFTV